MRPKASDRLVVALDVDTVNAALALAELLREEAGYFKIGMQLFCRQGARAIEALTGAGFNIFADLKLHDIPNTVYAASAALAEQAVSIFNVHALGGSAMMAAAVEGAHRGAGCKSKVLAVTILTSLARRQLEAELGMSGSVEETVERLATLAKRSGLDGVVASAKEAGRLRRLLGPDFIILTPGIRPDWAAAGDQKRISTPGDAIKDGADYLVVGRPITQAANPREAARKVVAEIEVALEQIEES